MVAGSSCGGQVGIECVNFFGLSCFEFIRQIEASDDNNCQESVVEISLTELLEEAFRLCFVQWVLAAVQHWEQILLNLLNFSGFNSIAVNSINIDFIWVQVDCDPIILHMVVNDVFASAIAFVECFLALVRVGGDALQHFPLIDEMLLDRCGHVISWGSIDTEDGDKAEDS